MEIDFQPKCEFIVYQQDVYKITKSVQYHSMYCNTTNNWPKTYTQSRVSIVSFTKDCCTTTSSVFPILTPSNQDVPPEVFPLRDEGQGQQGLQVHALHQQPEVIGQDAELEEGHG